MQSMLEIKCFKGKEIIPYISALAALRIKIFRNYPYLYDGNLAYEEEYLSTYVKCAASIMILAFDGNKVIGASTAVPLQFEMTECQQPFIEHHIAVKQVFYLGESLLLPQYRGQGIYRSFFVARETAALEYGCKIAAFVAIERDVNDPRQPQNYQPLDKVWEHFGYRKHPELCAYYEYKQIDEATASRKPMIFWLKYL